MKKLLLLAVAMCFVQVSAQKSVAWQKSGAENVAAKDKIRETPYSINQQLLQLNQVLFAQVLSNATDRSSGSAGTIISIPNISGQMEQYRVWENSNFEPALQAQFPDIRAYSGIGVTDKTATVNISVSPNGVQTMVLRANSGSEFIEPYTKDNSVYVLFDSATRVRGSLPFTCSTEDLVINNDLLNRAETSALASNGSYKTMRLALSCTGEYATYHGGTVAGATAAMNATMTRVNGVFEKDLALHLNIIAGNNAVVYTNAATDPYSPSSGMNNWNAQLQTTLTSVIGDANYDIGHLFGATGGGGNAGCIGCVCGPGKGSAYTSPADGIPAGDFFDIDYVAHEMGHQLGANHTFSHGNEGAGVNVEPGSGSTIMGYAGITDYDVQAHSDDYFTYRSILQIQNNLATKTCPVSTPITGNSAPVVDAGADWTIPKGTAFKLVGSATDAQGDALTYTWEQNDTGNGFTTGANSVAGPNKAFGPNFRSLPPVATPIRYMPALSSVLNNTLSTTWESVNNNARAYNFTLTARDHNPAGQQTGTDANIVTVSALHGPFTVTSQNTDALSWIQNTTQNITWTVNSTNLLVGSSNVNIRLSTDGGQTFPIMLAANTPNDGTETITVPNLASPTCRIMIEPVGNIYYAVNSKSFAIGYTLSNQCNTYSNTTPLSIPDGLGANVPGATVSSTINIPVNNMITDVNVTVNGTHSYFWDLVASVLHPDGTPVRLLNRECNNQSTGFNIVFNDGAPAIACVPNTVVTGTYAPDTALNAFNGKMTSGNWQLRVNDNYNGDTGTINSWSIEICAQVATLATQDYSLAEFSLYPNPNDGNFTVKFNSVSTNEISIAVHDIRGRRVFENQYGNTGLFSETIGLHHVESGIYLVTVQDGERKEIKKIVVN